MAYTAERPPSAGAGTPDDAHGGGTSASVTGAAVKRPECGALTDGLTRCVRPPVAGSERCAGHGGAA
jgi:hypothetical protein